MTRILEFAETFWFIGILFLFLFFFLLSLLLLFFFVPDFFLYHLEPGIDKKTQL